MGRWNRLTVEECRSISTKFLRMHSYLNRGVCFGGVSWNCNGAITGSTGFVVSTIARDEYIRFIYTQTYRNTGEKTKVDYKARLVSTPCYFGGRRWWFLCPQVVNGRTCGRRVGVLYLPGDKHFGCRHCFHLTYRSCKEHDKRLVVLLRNQELFMRYLDSENLSHNKLAVKTIFKYL